MTCSKLQQQGPGMIEPSTLDWELKTTAITPSSHTHTHTHTLRPKFMARCHRKYTPGEISSPRSSGSRVFSPPGGCARSCFQDGSSAPRTNTPGMRYHSPLFVRQIMCQPFNGSKVKEITVALCYCVCFALPFRSKEKH